MRSSRAQRCWTEQSSFGRWLGHGLLSSLHTEWAGSLKEWTRRSWGLKRSLNICSDSVLLFFCTVALVSDSLSRSSLPICALQGLKGSNTNNSAFGKLCAAGLFLRPPNGSVGFVLFVWFLFSCSSASIKEALSSAGPRISHVQGEALSKFQAAALLPRAPAAFTCI